MQLPKLEKRPKKHKFHNHEIEDDYNYLEENWQEVVKNPKLLKKEISDYIDAENNYADNYLKDTQKIQEILFKGTSFGKLTPPHVFEQNFEIFRDFV